MSQIIKFADSPLTQGEIILLPSSTASSGELGIEVKVKQVAVKQGLFGLEYLEKIGSRIR